MASGPAGPSVEAGASREDHTLVTASEGKIWHRPGLRPFLQVQDTPRQDAKGRPFWGGPKRGEPKFWPKHSGKVPIWGNPEKKAQSP